MKLGLSLFFILSATTLAQVPQSKTANQDLVNGVSTDQQANVPVRTLEFKPVETGPGLMVSPVTALPPHCTSDGSLFLDMLEPKDLTRHTVISVHGNKSETYSPSSIPDLHDIWVYSFFPSDSIVGFLVRATKDLPGPPGAGKSPAGVAWRDYHYYIAEFDRDGSYHKSIELPITYPPSHFAILPSGEFVVSGDDQLNSTGRLLFLDSSGQIIRQLDLPAFRTAPGGNAPYGSNESGVASSRLMGSIVFTPYDQDILVWRNGSSDPILDVGSGGSSREVSLQLPTGFVFVDMISSTDRWVAHFRKRAVAPNLPLNQTDYAYYEVRPQDGSLSSKLEQSGNVPLSIACESNGAYIAFKRDKDGKLILLKAD